MIIEPHPNHILLPSLEKRTAETLFRQPFRLRMIDRFEISISSHVDLGELSKFYPSVWRLVKIPLINEAATFVLFLPLKGIEPFEVTVLPFGHAKTDPSIVMSLPFDPHVLRFQDMQLCLARGLIFRELDQ